jgi:hypothetical protein
MFVVSLKQSRSNRLRHEIDQVLVFETAINKTGKVKLSVEIASLVLRSIIIVFLSMLFVVAHVMCNIKLRAPT